MSKDLELIGEKYLKSRYCMFELIEITRNKEFRERVFPIILPDSGLYDAITRFKYILYWEAQIKELDELLKQTTGAFLDDFHQELNLFTEIRNKITDIMAILKDMNALSLDIHQTSNFKTLIEAIKKRLNK